MHIRRSRTLPDNASYYYAAYAVATAIYVGYALVLTARRKRVRARHAAGKQG